MNAPSIPDRVLLAQIVAADFGDGDAVAQARLTEMLQQNPDVRTRHDDVQYLWDLLGELEPPHAEREAPPVEAPAVANGEAAPRRFAGRALAACLLGAIALAVALVGIGDTAGTARAFVITAGKAERRVADLPDGSTVELSGESRVVVDFASGRRRLHITSGEAYVRAAPGAAPLFVHAGNGTIRVAGAVDVDLQRRGVQLTVVTGTADVAVANARTGITQSAQLSGGQQVRFGTLAGPAPGSVLTTPAKVDVAGALDWTRGLLEFHGEPLADVIAEVNRHATGRIVLLDASQAAMPVYGVLHAGDLDGLDSMLRDQQAGRGRTARIVRVDPPGA